MNGKKYEIKPPEWKLDELSLNYSASGARCTYKVLPYKEKYDALIFFSWGAERLTSDCNSINDAKQACARHHMQYMEELLTEVKE